MARFKYKARNGSGQIVTGYAEAENQQLLKSGLRQRGLWLVQAKISRNVMELLTKNSTERISSLELVMYCRQMGVLLESGISLLRALDSLQESASSRFKPVLLRITEEIKSGRTYSSALALFPGIFSPFFIGMMEVGEAGGLLAEMHYKMTSHIEQGRELKKKMLFASIYPLMVMGVTIIGIGIILTVAFPKIADIYTRNKVELPVLTKIMLNLSGFLTHFWYIPLSLLLFLLYLILVVKIHRRSPVKEFLDVFVLKIPFYGDFIQRIALARITHNLSLLLEGGLPLLKGLDIIKTLLDNTVIQGYVDEIGNSVRNGEGITSYFRQNSFFPPLLTSMTRTGEESGQLAEMMRKAGSFYDQEVEDGVKKFTALLEPILIIIAAGGVFLVLLAFYLPMFRMMRVMGPH